MLDSIMFYVLYFNILQSKLNVKLAIYLMLCYIFSPEEFFFIMSWFPKFNNLVYRKFKRIEINQNRSSYFIIVFHAVIKIILKMIMGVATF